MILESAWLEEGNLWLEQLTGRAQPSFDAMMSWVFGLFWLSYHVFFVFRSGWHRHLQARKLLMDSDQIAAEVDEKYPQFLMSWGPLRGGQVQRSASDIELDKDTGTNATMYFGGKQGNILTFASYATKEVREDMSFCSYFGGALKGCFMRVLYCCCCERCRGDKERRKTINQRKTLTHATAIREEVHATMAMHDHGEVSKI